MSTLAATVLFALTLANTDPPKWEHIYTTDGIEGFSQKPTDSDFFGFKGIGIVDANVETVLNVISDVKHELEWVYLLKDHEVLSAPNTYERVEYQLFGLPWPVDDRDFVFQVKVTTLDEAGRVLIEITSVDVANAPPTRGVRGQLTKSLFLLEPHSENSTKLTVEIFSDPKGALPAWMVYFVQRRWPYATITGIREQVQLPRAKELPRPSLSQVGPTKPN